MKIDIYNLDLDELEDLPETAKIKTKPKIKKVEEDSNEIGPSHKKKKNERKEKQ